MIRRPPRSTRTDTLFPYTTLFRSGKFMNATAIVWTGHGAKAQTEAGTEDERRKNITASLLDGASYYFLDNINKPVDSSAYASATASPTWVDRPLGQSRKVEVPIRCTWIFCGNNPQLSGELIHRFASSEERRVGKECVRRCYYRG